MGGHLVLAFQTNPFFITFMGLVCFWVLAGALFATMGREVTVEVSAREKVWLWAVAGAAFLANWGYLWMAGI